MTPIISAIGINKAYLDHFALKNVHLEIPKNSIFGLLGPNGAGKTTFIRLITQITKPDSGTLLFENRNLHSSDINNIGYMPEERGLYKKMNVGEQAVYLAQLKGLSRPEAIKKLKYWFEKFEIAGWWNKKIEELSKGMQQKVQFIVTVVHEPSLIILDEPFSGFDPINADLIKDELIEISKMGATIILSTHRMESVEELCTDIALINKSRVLLSGPISGIIKDFSEQIYEIAYTGTLNLTDDTIINSRSDGNTNFVQIRLGVKPLNNLLLDIIPHVSILSVREVVPTMNEIFVKSVKNDPHA